MTVTLETTPERGALLEQEAARRGVSTAELATVLFEEMLEDLEDDAAAARILENTDPAEWKSLDDLRKAVRG